jgi:hypothetical protein
MFGIEEILSWIRRQVGLRTDTADAAGSLHAKVKNVADNKIGDSADVRADNTVMGWLATKVKSWQRVTFSPDNSPYTVNITSVTSSKCLVFLNGAGRGSTSDGSYTYYFAAHYYISGFTNTQLTVALSYSLASSGTYGILSAIIVELY